MRQAATGGGCVIFFALMWTWLGLAGGISLLNSGETVGGIVVIGLGVLGLLNVTLRVLAWRQRRRAASPGVRGQG